MLFKLIRIACLSAVCVVTSVATNCSAQTMKRIQPVHKFDYSYEPIIVDGVDINAWRYYNWLCGDYGLMGDSSRLSWANGKIRTDPDGEWTGVWISLDGVAADPQAVLNFGRAFHWSINPMYQPKIVGLIATLKGTGIAKLEIKSAQNQLKWQAEFGHNSNEFRQRYFTINPAQIGSAKFLNFVAEPGASFELDSLEFVYEFPRMPRDYYFFIVSYAKAAKNYNHTLGICRDRSNWPFETAQDNVPSSGLFAMVTAAASKLGVVTPRYARTVLHRTYNQISALPNAHGVLPHFINKPVSGAGVPYDIVPNSEFSTVDTAIYYLSMFSAAAILEDSWSQPKIYADAMSIDFARFTDSSGKISHGFAWNDRNTPLQHSWYDFGGETAIMSILAEIVTGDRTYGVMNDDGEIFRGHGFIGEIQSIWYPDFNSPVPDRESNNNWLRIRRDLFREQVSALRNAGSLAGAFGITGLSCGEAVNANGYVCNGSRHIESNIIHPHYAMQSTSVRTNLRFVYDMMTTMESFGQFPPSGLPEHFDFQLHNELPMNSSLNGNFEAISLYHLLMRNRAMVDEIYAASFEDFALDQGVRRFYPAR